MDMTNHNGDHGTGDGDDSVMVALSTMAMPQKNPDAQTASARPDTDGWKRRQLFQMSHPRTLAMTLAYTYKDC